MNEKETIDDIIAEMRAREDLDGGDMVDNFDIYNGEYGGWGALMLIKVYADRLEAAHMRELARVDSVIDEAVHGYPPEDIDDNREIGNCAKLREALIAMLDERCRQCYINDQICTQGLECHWNGKRGELCTHEAMDKAIAALAVPPRNCDIYDSYGDAIRAFEDDENAENYEEMAEWLFAPATAKEGGSK